VRIHRDHRSDRRVSRTHLVRVVLVAGTPSANDTVPPIRVVEFNVGNSSRQAYGVLSYSRSEALFPSGRA
jgi:hypothetical protein